MTIGAQSPLALLFGKGVLAPLDLHFAEALGRLVPDAGEAVLLGAALASRNTREGHVCVDLEKLAMRSGWDDEDGGWVEALPPVDEWRAQLARSSLVGSGLESTPLVLDARGRLYLRRYWQHETRLAELLRERVGRFDTDVERNVLRDSIRRLFGSPPASGVDWQRVAVQVALLTRFTVISGGPGTGKTSTVVKLVATLVEQALAADAPVPRVLLVAPTGKAAARLAESIRSAKGALDCTDAVRRAVVEEASTIHRALGVVPGSRVRVRHDADHPLRADVVIVDEASMVDVALMRRLVEAVPQRAKLVLLGDRDQLASVEAGAVLSDICGAGPPTYSTHLDELVADVFGESLPGPCRAGVGGVGDHIVELVHSHRFGAESGIGNLARAVRSGNADAALALLRAPEAPQVRLVSYAPNRGLGGLRRTVVEGFRPYLRATGARDALGLFECFRVLAVHRRGPGGVERLNRDIEQALRAAGLLARASGSSSRWYRGRPVLITRNDYALRLYNGDIGIVWSEKGRRTERAYFPGVGAGLRELAPARLPSHETAFAMSVHKSQGSELDEVVLVLPDERSPLLTRELLYTAVTRARLRVVLCGSEATLRVALARSVERSSGLRDLLWR